MQNECGRTLTETLVMLAIVGILSIVGIRGYTSAMDKSKANTLIQEAQKRAVVVAGQLGFNNQTPSLTEFSPYNTTSAGTFGDVITEGLSGQFGIQVSNVNKSICQNILNTIGDKTPIRRLSYETTPTTPITTCDEDNAFLFIYNNDMQAWGSDTEYAIDDSSCKSVCGVFNPSTHLCEESDCDVPKNECETDSQCNQENECMICDTETHKCKEGCERVQYLESTGTQYIDTRLDYFADFEIGIKLRTNVSNKAIGNTGFNCMQRYNATQSYWAFTTNSSSYVSSVSITEYHVMKWKDDTIYADGTQITTKQKSSNVGNNMGLFGAGGQKFPNMIYFCKLWNNNGTLVRDFVPVIAPDGKACMFNRVPDEEDGKLKLYCNSGSGNFKTNKD